MQYTRNQLTKAIEEMIAELQAREHLLRNLLSRVEPTIIFTVYDKQGLELSTEYGEWSLDRFISGQTGNKEDYDIRKKDNGEEMVDAMDACTYELLKKIIK